MANYKFKVFDASLGAKRPVRNVSQVEMVKISKHALKTAKSYGLDKGVTQKDLNRPVNAWSYLKNIGLGLKTNHPKRWD
jgi:hypothetical protein